MGLWLSGGLLSLIPSGKVQGTLVPLVRNICTSFWFFFQFFLSISYTYRNIGPRIFNICTSSLVAADEHFHRKESEYQLEETARSSQENMDLSDSRWYRNVIAHLLGCLHSLWSWKRDATVSEDYALMMTIHLTLNLKNTRSAVWNGPCIS